MATKGKGQQKDLQRQNINVYGWMIQLKETTMLEKRWNKPIQDKCTVVLIDSR